MRQGYPPEIEADLRKAARLEWWTFAWIGSIIVVMGLVMGSSQAMRTAWIEDVLSLIPAIVFLVALRFERRAPTRKYPFGFHGVHSMAFLISAVTLAGFGALLLWGAAKSLLSAEHVTIPPVHWFGEGVWLGWLMIGALIYSVVPPVILGRLKQPIARRLMDKVLHTDAMMQKADWMTGLAGAFGVLGIGLGLWWADAAAAAIISLDILRDGARALRIAVAELVDGAPRAIDSDEIAEDARALQESVEARFPQAEVRLRESGRYILAEIDGAEDPGLPDDPGDYWPGDPARAWRLAGVSFSCSVD